jgi:hypothetical protein
MANNWYEGLEMHGNTSINPFFYGTYLGETKPGEPVMRTKKQAFQADAVGAAHQLTPAHFNVTHTFRVEWQPGPGGRIDWFSRGHKVNGTFYVEGDGLGDDWVHAYGIVDKILENAMGSQIPIEPSYLIFNTAVSSTWGFPYDIPASCEKCYDCDDPKCACSFAPGFCDMLRDADVAMYIDSIRLYQSRDPSAHVGANHSIGCDPPEYPTKGWIKGHTYRYMRNAPFSFDDKGPIKNVQKGGGTCKSDDDCGANAQNMNLTEVFEDFEAEGRGDLENEEPAGRGKCIDTRHFKGMFSAMRKSEKVCQCNPGYTGPQCLAQEHIDDSPSAYVNSMKDTIFHVMPHFLISPFMIIILVALFVQVIVVICYVTTQRRIERSKPIPSLRRPAFQPSLEDRVITGTSI